QPPPPRQRRKDRLPLGSRGAHEPAATRPLPDAETRRLAAAVAVYRTRGARCPNLQTNRRNRLPSSPPPPPPPLTDRLRSDRLARATRRRRRARDVLLLRVDERARRRPVGTA